jgi:hypothetical protein
MEPRKWHYTYYSYEPNGRGYIGKRSSRVPPKEDPYLGSFSDKTFKPTRKIVIATYPTAQDALKAESALQHLFQVHKAEHFANQTIYPLGNFGDLAIRELRWDDPIRYQGLKERSEKRLEREAARSQQELDEWLPIIKLIHEEQQQLIKENKKDQMQAIYLLKNPFGLTLPVTGLEAFCKNNGLDFDGIQKLFSGEIDSWEGWTRGEPCFPWSA